MCNSMTSVELERKANLRRIEHAIFSVSMAINGLGVVETVALACEDPLGKAMSASIADEVSRLRNVLTTLNEARESLEEERMPIEFSEEKLLNNEWMDLDTEVTVPMSEKCDPKYVITGKTEDERAHERIESMLDAMESAPKVTDESHERFLNLNKDEPTPNLDERIETSDVWHGITSFCSEWDRRDAERRFTHHKPKPNQVNACETIRKAGMDIALTILGLCPATHERDRAIEAVDMAVMWANASIARHWYWS